MKIQIGMYGWRISEVLRESKRRWQEHERAGEHIIQFSVFLPKLAVLHVFRMRIWVRAMDMGEDLVVYVAEKDRSSKRGIRRSLERFREGASLLFPSLVESLLRRREVGGDLSRSSEISHRPQRGWLLVSPLHRLD